MAGSPLVHIPDEQPAPASAAPHATDGDGPDSRRVPETFASGTQVGTGLTGGEQSTLDEIRRKLREGAEVVCIVRDRNDPKSQSEVFTLDRASPIFVNQLARASQAPSVPHETALEVPKRRTPIVEWDAAAGGFIHQNPLPR